MRIWIAIAGAALVASCRTAPAGPPRTAGPVKTLPAHAGATALWHDRDLWVSYDPEPGHPGPIRLSRGDRPIQRTLSGWVLGVHAGRAIVAAGAGKAIRISSVDPTGEPIVLGEVPQPARGDDVYTTITAAGEAIVIDAGRHDAAGAVRIVGPGGVRAFPIVPPQASVVGFAADPRAPRLALLIDDSGGKLTWHLVIVDTQTGRLLSDRPFPAGPTADWVGFDDSGAVWIHGYHGFTRSDGAGDRQVLDGTYPDGRTIVLAPSGAAVAYARSAGDSDMGFLTSHRCSVYYLRTAETGRLHKEALAYPTFCRQGLGLAIVGDTLWVAPPVGVAPTEAYP